MTDLKGLGVLVTRPEAQAGLLTGLLHAQGFRVFHLPTLQTERVGNPVIQRAALGPLDHYHWIIFLSVNAVHHAAHLLDHSADSSLIAVGPATAAALTERGHPPALIPRGGFSSEDLLNLPDLQSVRGQRILIVRGADGLETLGDALTQRGAQITYAEVYKRVRATPLPGAVAAVEREWAAGQIQVVTATSTDVLKALFELLSTEGRDLLTLTALLAASARIGHAARQMGLNGELIVAQAADSASLVSALTQWQRAR